MPDEPPELPVAERCRRLVSCDFEVVEIARHLLAVRPTVDADIEHPRGSAVEPLVDRADAARAYDLNEAVLGQHLNVVGDGGLRPLERRRQLRDRCRTLVQEAENDIPQRVAERSDLLRL